MFMNCFSPKNKPIDLFELMKGAITDGALNYPDEFEKRINSRTTGAVTNLKKRSETDHLVKQLERKNLEDEHGHAVCSQNSSKSTKNSNKRKRNKKNREFHEYKNLMDNWRPPSCLQSDNLDLDDDDDQSWLFQRKPKQKRVEEKNAGNKNDTTNCGRSPALWQPRAQYLHDVDLYALPYTVPF